MSPLEELSLAWEVAKARRAGERSQQLDQFSRSVQERASQGAHQLQEETEQLKRELEDLQNEFTELRTEAASESFEMKKTAEIVQALLSQMRSGREQLERESSQRSSVLSDLTDGLNRLCK